MAGAMEKARFEQRPGFALVSFPLLPFPWLNGLWTDDDCSVEALAGAVAELEPTGAPLGVLTRRTSPEAVAEAARQLGFTADERMPGMALTTAELVPPPEPDFDVITVESSEEMARALAVAAEGFEVAAEILAPVYSPAMASLDGYVVYLARKGGADLSTATRYVAGEDVGIFNVATPAEYRGRGYGAAITAHALRDGFSSGASFGWLQSSALGESIYRRLGFREVETYRLLVRPA